MNWVCALGVLPFFFAGGVGAVVAINGVAFHVFFAESWEFKAYDVAVNACIAMYYNWAVFPHPVVHALSASASACFVANSLILARGLAKETVHVLLVQWPMLVALVVATAKPVVP